jgi:hypothetical protein
MFVNMISHHLANMDISFRNNQAIYVKCDYYIIVSSYLLCYVGKEPEFKRTSFKGPYSGTNCSDGYTVISYNDVIQFEKQLTTKHFSSVPIWINAMAEYTPWMIYRGK